MLKEKVIAIRKNWNRALEGIKEIAEIIVAIIREEAELKLSYTILAFNDDLEIIKINIITGSDDKILDLMKQRESVRESEWFRRENENIKPSYIYIDEEIEESKNLFLLFKKYRLVVTSRSLYSSPEMLPVLFSQNEAGRIVRRLEAIL